MHWNILICQNCHFNCFLVLKCYVIPIQGHTRSFWVKWGHVRSLLPDDCLEHMVVVVCIDCMDTNEYYVGQLLGNSISMERWVLTAIGSRFKSYFEFYFRSTSGEYKLTFMDGYACCVAYLWCSPECVWKVWWFWTWFDHAVTGVVIETRIF